MVLVYNFNNKPLGVESKLKASRIDPYIKGKISSSLEKKKSKIYIYNEFEVLKPAKIMSVYDMGNFRIAF